MGETLLDLASEEGGCIAFVLISGSLRFRLSILAGSMPLTETSLSISSGDSRIPIDEGCWDSVLHPVSINSLAVRRLGSMGMEWKVWLRGRFVLFPENGSRA